MPEITDHGNARQQRCHGQQGQYTNARGAGPRPTGRQADGHRVTTWIVLVAALALAATPVASAGLLSGSTGSGGGLVGSLTQTLTDLPVVERVVTTGPTLVDVRVEPAEALPGQAVTILITLDDGGLVRLSTAGPVTCDVTFPDGSVERPCAGLATVPTLAIARDEPAATLAVPYVAPAEPGLYTLDVSVPGALGTEETAQRSFRVVPAPADEAQASDEEALRENAQAGSSGGAGDGDGPSGWLTKLWWALVAIAVVVLAILVFGLFRRDERKPGGRPSE